MYEVILSSPYRPRMWSRLCWLSDSQRGKNESACFQLAPWMSEYPSDLYFVLSRLDSKSFMQERTYTNTSYINSAHHQVDINLVQIGFELIAFKPNPCTSTFQVLNQSKQSTVNQPPKSWVRRPIKLFSLPVCACCINQVI